MLDMKKQPKTKVGMTINEARVKEGLKPFEFRRKPEVDAKIDSYLDRHPEFAARIEITDKEYFTRHYVLRIVERVEERQQYDSNLKNALDLPENREEKARITEGVSRIVDPRARQQVFNRDVRAAARQGRIHVPKLSA
jgi:hypothetical protein